MCCALTGGAFKPDVVKDHNHNPYPTIIKTRFVIFINPRDLCGALSTRRQLYLLRCICIGRYPAVRNNCATLRNFCAKFLANTLVISKNSCIKNLLLFCAICVTGIFAHACNALNKLQ